MVAYLMDWSVNMGMFTEPIARPIPVAIVIVHSKKDDTILMTRTLQENEYNLFVLPGGKQEHKERMIDTARRELLEETNLVAKSMRCLGIIDVMLYEHFVCGVYLCQDFEGELKTLEPLKHDGWQWILRTNISDMGNKSESLHLLHQGDFFYGW